MSEFSGRSGYSDRGRVAARIVLAVFVVVAAGAVAVTQSSLRQGYAHVEGRGRDSNDIVLYDAVARRIRDGETYYAASAVELTARGYPTASVFNWRTPLPMALIAYLPHPLLAKLILGTLSGLLVLLVLEWMSRERGPIAGLLATLLVTGALMFGVLGNKYAMPVLWAGPLLGISFCAYGLGWRRTAIVAGVAAAFFRDLAAPYCVFALGYAMFKRRWREAAGWALGLALYAAYFAWHAMQATLHMPAGAEHHAESWLQFGGAGFLVSLAQVNAYLLPLPQWVAGLYLVLALVGFAGARGEAGQRAGICTACYLIGFAFIGHDFNQYWGALVAPVLCVGAALAPAALSDLVQRAIGRRQPTAMPSRAPS